MLNPAYRKHTQKQTQKLSVPGWLLWKLVGHSPVPPFHLLKKCWHYRCVPAHLVFPMDSYDPIQVMVICVPSTYLLSYLPGRSTQFIVNMIVLSTKHAVCLSGVWLLANVDHWGLLFSALHLSFLKCFVLLCFYCWVIPNSSKGKVLVSRVELHQ